MRLLLMFDLPTTTSNERKIYRNFRKFLINEGFIMHQYSIYSKILLNNSAKNLLIKRIKKNAPDDGLVTVLSVTEKQFSKMVYIAGQKSERLSNTDQRLIILEEADD